MFAAISGTLFADASTKAPSPSAKTTKRFINPAKQFEGWWQVERYVARKGYELPTDWQEPVRKDPGYLPVGHFVHIVHVGDGYVSGFHDKDGFPSRYSPSGEMIDFTFFGPFTPDFCIDSVGGEWKTYCSAEFLKSEKYFKSTLVMTKFVKFKPSDLTTAPNLWPEVSPVEYELMPEANNRFLSTIWIGKDKKTLWLPLLYGKFATVLKRVEKPAHLSVPKAN